MTVNKYKTKREMFLEFMHQVRLIQAKHVADAKRNGGGYRERLQRWSVTWGYQLFNGVGDRVKKLARSRAGFKLKFFN